VRKVAIRTKLEENRKMLERIAAISRPVEVKG
jgi:hypothetical protein